MYMYMVYIVHGCISEMTSIKSVSLYDLQLCTCINDRRYSIISPGAHGLLISLKNKTAFCMLHECTCVETFGVDMCQCQPMFHKVTEYLGTKHGLYLKMDRAIILFHQTASLVDMLTTLSPQNDRQTNQ